METEKPTEKFCSRPGEGGGCAMVAAKAVSSQETWSSSGGRDLKGGLDVRYEKRNTKGSWISGLRNYG